jgi:hypothetical protein
MMFPFMIDESSFSDSANGVGEDTAVWRYQGFQVSWRRSWPPAPRIKILGNDPIDQSRIAAQLGFHLIVGVLASSF